MTATSRRPFYNIQRYGRYGLIYVISYYLGNEIQCLRAQASFAIVHGRRGGYLRRHIRSQNINRWADSSLSSASASKLRRAAKHIIPSRKNKIKVKKPHQSLYLSTPPSPPSLPKILSSPQSVRSSDLASPPTALATRGSTSKG